MSQHTPGPWRLADCGKHRPGDEAWKRCAHIATIDGPLPTTLANMQLKAAAPDLLAALEDMINHCQGCNGRGRCYGRVPGSPGSYASNQPCQDCGDARAAIAKAKGETTW